MDKLWLPLLLLWMAAVVALDMENITEAVENNRLVMINKALKVIPHNNNNNTTSITKLVIEKNLITLNDVDQRALATYPALEELHLDGNLVTAIPAKYFSVVPNLKVLSLSANNISSLDPEAFSGLNVLTEVDLSHNLLASFPHKLFRGLNNLKVLKLHKNPWNCSCPLLISIQEVKEANVNIGGPLVTCASPKKQAGNELSNATAVCYPSSQHTLNGDSQNPTTPVNFQQIWVSSTLLNTTDLLSQNHSTSKDPTPVLGNSWKFTVCVGALALTTLMLIIIAIKGPSWYRLYHNYRHRRLNQDRDVGTDIVSPGFSTRYFNHQTFNFKQTSGQIVEEEEDVEEYFEDPYIKKEELNGVEENLPEP